MNEIDLFDLLQILLKCEYISDLHIEPYNSQAKRYLNIIDFRQYSFEELNDLINYIYSNNKNLSKFDTTHAVDDYLLGANGT